MLFCYFYEIIKTNSVDESIGFFCHARDDPTPCGDCFLMTLWGLVAYSFNEFLTTMLILVIISPRLISKERRR